MTSNKVTHLSTKEGDPTQLLNEALGRNFDEVCIIGMKDGKVYVDISSVEDVIQTLGFLELAKLELFKTWD